MIRIILWITDSFVALLSAFKKYDMAFKLLFSLLISSFSMAFILVYFALGIQIDYYQLLFSIVSGFVVGLITSGSIAQIFERRSVRILLCDDLINVLFKRVSNSLHELEIKNSDYERKIASSFIGTDNERRNTVKAQEFERSYRKLVREAGTSFDLSKQKWRTILSESEFKHLRKQLMSIVAVGLRYEWTRNEFVREVYYQYVIFPFFRQIESKLYSKIDIQGIQKDILVSQAELKRNGEFDPNLDLDINVLKHDKDEYDLFCQYHCKLHEKQEIYDNDNPEFLDHLMEIDKWYKITIKKEFSPISTEDRRNEFGKWCSINISNSWFVSHDAKHNDVFRFSNQTEKHLLIRYIYSSPDHEIVHDFDDQELTANYLNY